MNANFIRGTLNRLVFDESVHTNNISKCYSSRLVLRHIISNTCQIGDEKIMKRACLDIYRANPLKSHSIIEDLTY